MQIQIGLDHSSQSPLTLEPKLSAEELKARIESIINRENNVLVIEDVKGGVTYIDTTKINYIRIIEEDNSRVGFGLV